MSQVQTTYPPPSLLRLPQPLHQRRQQPPLWRSSLRALRVVAIVSAVANLCAVLLFCVLPDRHILYRAPGSYRAVFGGTPDSGEIPHPVGRWEKFLVLDPLREYHDPLDLEQDFDDSVHYHAFGAPHDELRRRSLPAEDVSQLPLHFTLDSVEEDALGRNVATSMSGLVNSFYAIARAEKEASRLRAGVKARNRRNLV